MGRPTPPAPPVAARHPGACPGSRWPTTSIGSSVRPRERPTELTRPRLPASSRRHRRRPVPSCKVRSALNHHLDVGSLNRPPPPAPDRSSPSRRHLDDVPASGRTRAAVAVRGPPHRRTRKPRQGGVRAVRPTAHRDGLGPAVLSSSPIPDEGVRHHRPSQLTSANAPPSVVIGAVAPVTLQPRPQPPGAGSRTITWICL